MPLASFASSLPNCIIIPPHTPASPFFPALYSTQLKISQNIYTHHNYIATTPPPSPTQTKKKQQTHNKIFLEHNNKMKLQVFFLALFMIIAAVFAARTNKVGSCYDDIARGTGERACLSSWEDVAGDNDAANFVNACQWCVAKVCYYNNYNSFFHYSWVFGLLCLVHRAFLTLIFYSCSFSFPSSFKILSLIPNHTTMTHSSYQHMYKQWCYTIQTASNALYQQPPLPLSTLRLSHLLAQTPSKLNNCHQAFSSAPTPLQPVSFKKPIGHVLDTMRILIK